MTRLLTIVALGLLLVTVALTPQSVRAVQIGEEGAALESTESGSEAAHEESTESGAEGASEESSGSKADEGGADINMEESSEESTRAGWETVGPKLNADVKVTPEPAPKNSNEKPGWTTVGKPVEAGVAGEPEKNPSLAPKKKPKSFISKKAQEVLDRFARCKAIREAKKRAACQGLASGESVETPSSEESENAKASVAVTKPKPMKHFISPKAAKVLAMYKMREECKKRKAKEACQQTEPHEPDSNFYFK
eukprot:TRINITY_DN61926_c1_g1_i1.p2 TRINITY_DN61926_c1_g1~~TRINITY_DN61926_c1_g1_i1.p2  ORF type:complete len:266 (+),score=125.67 TRINITY_DN61926_c1_g1_i1:47-799(+)